MHEANFELIEIPHVRLSGKNSADIRLVVDALDLCYTKAHVNTFVIISGDSDFSPLVSKLRENAKRVIGVGVKDSTSDLLVANCDEFIFYDDLVRESRRQQAGRRDTREQQPKRSAEEEKRRKEEMEKRRNQAVEIAYSTFDALAAERGEGKIWASVLKEAIKRRKPDFSESYHGFRTFGNLLEEMKARGLLEFGRDEKSGAYVYRGNQPVVAPVAASESAMPAEGEGASVEQAAPQQEAGEAREGREGGKDARRGRGNRGGRNRRGGAPSPDMDDSMAADIAAAEQALEEQTSKADAAEVDEDAAAYIGAVPRQADVPGDVDASADAEAEAPAPAKRGARGTARKPAAKKTTRTSKAAKAAAEAMQSAEAALAADAAAAAADSVAAEADAEAAADRAAEASVDVIENELDAESAPGQPKRTSKQGKHKTPARSRLPRKPKPKAEA
jgi:hypothetical protein